MCVYGWLKMTQPDVFVLTNGSGRSHKSRIASTTEVLAAAHAKPGPLYGAFTDRDFYRALLDFDFEFFARIVTGLAGSIMTKSYEAVSGDAAEGYNPIHDVCRTIINAALEIATRRSGREILNREFSLFRRHDGGSAHPRPGAVRLELSDEVLQEKLNLARKYPELRPEVEAALDGKMLPNVGVYSELNAEVAAMITGMGSEAYRIECLNPVKAGNIADDSQTAVPFYERYGELLVSAKLYDQAIGYAKNIRPMKERLQRFVASQGDSGG